MSWFTSYFHDCHELLHKLLKKIISHSKPCIIFVIISCMLSFDINTKLMRTNNDFDHFTFSPRISLYRVISLTHWCWVTHICVNKLTIIGSDNGLSPGCHQAIIWTNAGILLIGPLGTNFSEILNRNLNIFIQHFPKIYRGKISWAFPVKLLLGESLKASLIVSQYWFR